MSSELTQTTGQAWIENWPEEAKKDIEQVINWCKTFDTTVNAVGWLNQAPRIVQETISSVEERYGSDHEAFTSALACLTVAYPSSTEMRIYDDEAFSSLYLECLLYVIAEKYDIRPQDRARIGEAYHGEQEPGGYASVVCAAGVFRREECAPMFTRRWVAKTCARFLVDHDEENLHPALVEDLRHALLTTIVNVGPDAELELLCKQSRNTADIYRMIKKYWPNGYDEIQK